MLLQAMRWGRRGGEVDCQTGINRIRRALAVLEDVDCTISCSVELVVVNVLPARGLLEFRLMLRELAGRAGRGSFSGDARRVVSDGIRCFERIDEALVSDTESDFGRGARGVTAQTPRTGRLAGSSEMVDSIGQS